MDALYRLARRAGESFYAGRFAEALRALQT
jgi:hypothetical protein